MGNRTRRCWAIALTLTGHDGGSERKRGVNTLALVLFSMVLAAAGPALAEASGEPLQTSEGSVENLTEAK
jgi:hypothetical protein